MAIIGAYLCDSYEADNVQSAVDLAINACGGLDWVRPGMRIAVKVNLLTGGKPEKAITTHPSVVCAVVKRLLERGAQVTVGDSPSGPMGGPRLDSIYSITGMKQVEALGAALNYDVRQTEMPYDGLVLKDFSACTFFAEADAIVNICKLKTHGMMGMTAAVKNIYGVIPGLTKAEYHLRYKGEDNFANMLIDLNSCFKPRMHIIDAVTAMEGNGPSAGNPRQVGVIAASADPYALDFFCAGLIHINKEDVPTIKAAENRGLIPDSIEVIGDGADVSIDDFVLIRERKSSEFKGEKGISKTAGEILQRTLGARPTVKKDLCIGCGHCAKMCPNKAITIRDGKAVIDRKKCIYCFCCQELCPKGAMIVDRTFIAKLIGKM